MIEAITQDEFEAAVPRRGRRLGLESRAMLALRPLEGIKMPCRWPHYQKTCSGANNFARRAKRHSIIISATCQDGTLYVFRYE